MEWIELWNRPLRETAEKCAEVLLDGGILAIPTDTVYGMVCGYSQTAAIENIYRIKSREPEKPFALFTNANEKIQRLPVSVTPQAFLLMEAFWPGSLTIVFPAENGVSCAKNGKLGIRRPDNPLIWEIIRLLDDFLVNTSLNPSGQSTPLSLKGMETWLSQLDLVVDGGTLAESPPSTVVDCSKFPITILREGAIGRDVIEKVLKETQGDRMDN